MCLGENAPPLVSVSQVAVCMNCPVHFSLTHRRHHCHACGKVITDTKVHTHLKDIVNQMDLSYSLHIICHRLCAETAVETKSLWNTWRTDEPKCAISATVSFAKMASSCVCFSEWKKSKVKHYTKACQGLTGVVAYWRLSCPAYCCWISDIYIYKVSWLSWIFKILYFLPKYMYSEGDASVQMGSSSRPLSTVFQNIHPSSLWRSRKGHLSFNQVTVHIRSVFNSVHTHCYAQN